MAKRVVKYKIELVKETSKNYDIDNKMTSPDVVHQAIETVFNLSVQAEEILVLLALDTKNKIIGAFEVSRGSLNSSLVHPREVFKRAILLNASSIIVAHNHPSGDPTPSKDDINVTERLSECGELLGIRLLDHLIIGDDKYLSLKAKGVL